jgi:hypothetical protein
VERHKFLGEVLDMRTIVLASIVFALVVVVFPTAASAGWGGSPYEKSQCVRQDSGDGRPGLRCERTFTRVRDDTQVFPVADASCPSGQRLVRHEKLVEETWVVFDVFLGPVPDAKFALFGDEYPVSFRVISDVTTSECVP